MLKKMIIALALILVVPIGFSQSLKVCSDSNTLNITKEKTLIIEGNSTPFQVIEQVNCPGGCVNGECKAIVSSMPIEIYIFFSIVSISLMILSFLKPDILIIKWVSVIILGMLGVASFNLNRVYCEYTTSGWDCYIHRYMASNLAYLWFGLGLVMFVYAVLSSIIKPAEYVAEAEKEVERRGSYET